MALTNSGFNGTVNEAQWAYIGRIGDADGVESSAAWLVSAGVGRQVSVAAQAGYAYACGVLSKDTAAITANLSTPVNGQWHLIVRRINWAGDLVSVVAVAHTTTSTTVPTAAPTTFPAISSTPGTEYDHKLAWAWVNSVNTTVTLFDLRELPVGDRLAQRQVRTFKVADATARGLLTGMSEGDLADQADTNATYRYDGAAWKNASGGLVPIIPTSVVGGTVSAGGAVTFSLAGIVSINGVFSSEFDNYKIIESLSAKSAVVDTNLRLRASGTDASGPNYNYVRGFDAGTARTVASSTNGTSTLIDVGGGVGDAEITLYSPALTQATRMIDLASGAGIISTIGCFHSLTVAYDGFTIFPSSGTISGKIRIYGFNNN